ncbi:hypothetical protein AAG906_039314 [Vitis piasezkii]
MESCVEIKNGLIGDVENTIFVVVGKRVEKSKTTLFWVVKNFSGKRVCVLYVHQPEKTYASGKASYEHERQNMLKLLNQCLLILAQMTVRAYKLWIEMENIEKGIVEIIAQKNIKWLVMGDAADKYYSKIMKIVGKWWSSSPSEKKLEPEASFEILTNLVRVVPAQEKFIKFLEESRYVPG